MQLKHTEVAPGATKELSPPQYAPEPSARATAEGVGRLSPLDKRQVFKQMVVGSLESGFLRYSKRKALLAYAAGIGLSEFDAMLLIAEAQFYSDRIDPTCDDSWLLKEPPRIEIWSAATKLLMAVGIAAIIDVALICWFFV